MISKSSSVDFPQRSLITLMVRPTQDLGSFGCRRTFRTTGRSCDSNASHSSRRQESHNPVPGVQGLRSILGSSHKPPDDKMDQVLPDLGTDGQQRREQAGPRSLLHPSREQGFLSCPYLILHFQGGRIHDRIEPRAKAAQMPFLFFGLCAYLCQGTLQLAEV